ncbi:hypothetical protein FK529_02460 [Tsukamurella asaccharolytica]|uniref:Uncharacterized protein n=1 Tax=Tsukamurella asaccharolytica TaxID=2592067 RepID=A0A5C5RGC5_9ACTN|nr:hypothetical protein [Tsukamurella asaccharolytica]TWS21473.1 hypothetical protein FK529_02460 [Tsukamurella asaccharolytica]
MHLEVRYCELWNSWYYEGVDPIPADEASSLFESTERDFSLSAVVGKTGFFERKEQPMFVVRASLSGTQVLVLNNSGSEVQSYSYRNIDKERMFLFGYTRHEYADSSLYTPNSYADRTYKWGFSEDGTFEFATIVPGTETDWGNVHSGLDTSILWRERAKFGDWRNLTVVGIIGEAVEGFVGIEWPDVTIDDHGRAHVDSATDVISVANFPATD